MKILWLCNFMLPAVAEKLGLEDNGKEGWISGLAGEVLKRNRDNGISLAVAFPVKRDMDGYTETLELQNGGRLECYGFYEDIEHPERYDVHLESSLAHIVSQANPDIVHCFGTEYAHTLAMCRCFPRKERILIGIQGLCAICVEAYLANLPGEVIYDKTLRDTLKRDTLLAQRSKFAARGKRELQAIRLAGNLTGRTPWDRHFCQAWNVEASYYEMNETLRPVFYEDIWREEQCIPHSIFVSQGDYPLKGLHYLLLALPRIMRKYPDTTVYVAGNSLVRYGTWKEKLKISTYGKYLRRLLKQKRMEDKVHFLGTLTAEEMKRQYLRSHLFVCCSALENSPNSLGEAMLLGMPCVSADVGGIPGIFRDGVDGITYVGFHSRRSSFDRLYHGTEQYMHSWDAQRGEIVESLTGAVLQMWEDEEKQKYYCENARKHALKTHDGESNYLRLTEIYAEIAGK